MIQRIQAEYRDGAFFPERPFTLPQHTKVQLTIETSLVAPPSISDPEERKQRRKEFIAQLKSRSIPAGAPAKFTRDELHERR